MIRTEIGADPAPVQRRVTFRREQTQKLPDFVPNEQLLRLAGSVSERQSHFEPRAGAEVVC